MIRRSENRMKKYTLTKRILLAFLIVTIPLTTVLFGVTSYSRDVILDKVSKSNQNLLDGYIEQIDSYLRDADAYLERMKYQVSSEILWNYSNEEDYILMLQSLRNQLRRDLGVYSPAEAMFIYDFNRQRIITTETLLGQQLEAGRLLEEAQEYRTSKQPWSIQENEEGKMLVYKMIYVKSGIYIGVVFQESRLLPELKGLEEDSRVRLLTDEEMETLSPSDSGKYLVISKESALAPLQLRLEISKDAIFAPLYVIQKIQYIVPFLILAAALLYIWLLRISVVRPIKILENAMQQVGGGDWNVRIQEVWKGEFSSIARGFNDMVEHVHKLKIDTYDKKLQLQKAEYRYLQMQINPHFYINTLNILYNMSVLKENESVQQLAIYLSNHFKYIQSADQHLAKLNKEIEYTVNYLRINQMRFGDNLNYTVRVEPEKNSYYIPMITIQTFVENCIMHGFKERNRPFLIGISVIPWEENPRKYFEVRITDTGIGFDAEYLKSFEWEKYPGKSQRHIGIINTIWRLRLWYGGDCRIYLENRPKGGAQVRLILPNERREFGMAFRGNSEEAEEEEKAEEAEAEEGTEEE